MSQTAAITPTEHKASPMTDLAPLQVIRTETVFSRLPIHNLAKKGRVDIKITKKVENGDIELLWDVSYNEKYGQPRQLAYKLDTIVINRKIDELGRPIPKVIRLDSLTQTYRDLGVEPGGRNKTDLRHAFLQNAFTAITAKLQYKAKDGTEKTLEAGFTRYSVIFTGERLPDGRKADAVYLVLNDIYRDVLNNVPTRPLDYEYLKILPPAAQRFYEIISYKIYAALKNHLPHAQLPYSEYCTFAAQQRYTDYDHFKKQMYKVHKPHRDSTYIEKVWYEPTTDSDNNPDWLMCYTPGPKAKAEYQTFNKTVIAHDDQLALPGVLDRVDPTANGTTESREEGIAHDPTITDDRLETQARELVHYFHQRFHQVEPPAKIEHALAQATGLIARHGMDQAKHIIDFSHTAAQETKYKPASFGGILQYETRALADYETAKLGERQKATTQACPFCDKDGWLTFEKPDRTTFVNKCSHDQTQIQAYCESRGVQLLRF